MHAFTFLRSRRRHIVAGLVTIVSRKLRQPVVLGYMRIMSAEIVPKGDRLEVGAVRPLFQTRSLQSPVGAYDNSADGKRFLVVSESEQWASEPITLVVNSTAALRR